MSRLAVTRGLLTCCRPSVLLSSQADATQVTACTTEEPRFTTAALVFITESIFLPFQTCLLLKGLFPLVHDLCEEKLDCHYFAFEGE